MGEKAVKLTEQPVAPEFSAVLERILGDNIERKLIELARIGGVQIDRTSELPERYAVTRLALSPEDFEARHYLQAQLEAAGMRVSSHPLGVMGIIEGTDSALPPIIMMSHFDSVPDAGMYDGTVGVVSALEVARALHDSNITLKRNVIVLAVTGEESSRFNMALFGSRGIFHGLKPAELASHREGDITISQAVEQAKYSVENISKPWITRAGAVVELHVDQTGELERNGIDLGVVEAIAAPDRHRIIIGDPLQRDTETFENVKLLELNVKGKAGHSGATPMGREYRADGLVVTSEFLSHLSVLQVKFKDKNLKISVGGIEIEGQALNKIPGQTTAVVRVTGDNNDEIQSAIDDMNEFVTRRGQHYERSPTKFVSQPIRLTEIPIDDQKMAFFDIDQSLQHHAAAGRIIMNVSSVSNLKDFSGKNVVGTVGTYSTNNMGQIVLGIDIRGIDKDTRDRAVAKILGNIETITRHMKIKYQIEQMAGSMNPVWLDQNLVETAERVIEEQNLGSHVRTFSAAGHDTINAQLAGFPSLMLFIPSENGGIAHTSKEYTSPKYLEKGARTLAALVCELAAH